MSYPNHLAPPRLCHLKKWTTFAGYGFNLHAEKGKAGQYIGKVDPNSPAEHGGLKTKDYLVEVNSINVEDLTHQRVVEIVKEWPSSVKMLVVDYEAYKYCKDNGIFISSSMPEVVSISTPDTQPSAAGGVIEEHQDIQHETAERQEVESEEAAPDTVESPSQAYDEAADSQCEKEAVRSDDQQEVSTINETEQNQLTESANRGGSPRQDQSIEKNGQTSGPTAPPASKDPVGNLSLEEMRAKIGNNRRTQVKMNPSSFSEKYSMFQAL